MKYNFKMYLSAIFGWLVVCLKYGICTKWPDPKHDELTYVSNPIEAGLPSHWMPLSVVKRILENKTVHKTKLTKKIIPPLPTKKRVGKIKRTTALFSDGRQNEWLTWKTTSKFLKKTETNKMSTILSSIPSIIAIKDRNPLKKGTNNIPKIVTAPAIINTPSIETVTPKTSTMLQLKTLTADSETKIAQLLLEESTKMSNTKHSSTNFKPTTIETTEATLKTGEYKTKANVPVKSITSSLAENIKSETTLLEKTLPVTQSTKDTNENTAHTEALAQTRFELSKPILSSTKSEKFIPPSKEFQTSTKSRMTTITPLKLETDTLSTMTPRKPKTSTTPKPPPKTHLTSTTLKTTPTETSTTPKPPPTTTSTIPKTIPTETSTTPKPTPTTHLTSTTPTETSTMPKPPPTAHLTSTTPKTTPTETSTTPKPPPTEYILTTTTPQTTPTKPKTTTTPATLPPAIITTTGHKLKRRRTRTTTQSDPFY